MEILYSLHLFCLLFVFAFLYFQYEETDKNAITSSVRSPSVCHIMTLQMDYGEIS